MSADALPTGRLGQVLAVAIGVAAIALVWFGLIVPLHDWYSDRALLLERRQALLARMQQVAASRSSLQTAADSKRGLSETGLLPGTSDALAAAGLQERVQQMASAAGATLTAAETLPATTTGRWHKVPLRISLNAPWPVLIELLNAIQRSPTRIMVDDLHFHSATVVNRPTVLPVQASMIVYSFRSAEAGT